MKFSKVKLQITNEKDFDYNSKRVKTPLDIVKYINEIEKLDKEAEEITIMVCLNSKNQIVAYSEVAKGSLNCCYIDMKTIFKTILLCNASKFILVHNHPTGIAEMSKNDVSVSNRLREVSKLMDVELLDHIIVGNDDFVSCMNLPKCSGL